MCRLFKNLLFLVLSSCYAIASSVSPFYSHEEKRRAFSVSEQGYQDIRYDFDSNKSIDLWDIKKDNLEISVHKFGQRTAYFIRQFKNSQVSERIVVAHQGILYLIHAQDRKMRVYYQEDFAGLCPKIESEWAKLKDLQIPIKTATLNQCAENYLDSSCEESSSYILMQDVLKATYAPPVPLSNKLLTCLEGEDAKKIFEVELKKEEGAKAHLRSVTLYKQTILNFLHSSNGNSKPVVSCKTSSDPNERPKSTESGQIQIIVSSNSQPAAGADLKQNLTTQVFHETLHTLKVENEKIVADLTKLCVKNEKLSEILKGQSGGSVLLIDSTKAAATASLKASDAIPASIAEAPKPLPPSGSPQEMNRVADALGAEQTMKISRSQTSGMIRMAENVLSATPAVAASTTTTLASNSKTSSGSRLPASEPSPTSFKATNAALNNLKSGTKSKAREYITEEIDLTKQAVTTSGSTANTRAAQSIKNNPTAAADISAPPSSDVIPATSGSASAGSSSRGFDSGSGPNSGRSANSRPSNRNVASTSNGNPVERAEVIKTITKGSYKETQAQLKSPAFQEKLKNNGIRIYNLKGGDFGARDARTVFLDTGATFVLEE